MNLLLHYTIALGTTSVALFTLAVFVYMRGPKVKVNWAFALYSLSIAIWSGFEAYSIIAPTKASGLFWWRINHIGVIFIPVFFVHFVINLLGIERQNRKVMMFFYLLGFIFLILDTTPLLIADVVPKFSFKNMVVPGKLYFVFFILWIVAIGFGLFKLFLAYNKSTGIRRNQLKYLCWTSLIGYIGGPPNFLPAFNIELFPFMPFGTYGVPLYGLVIAYAIVKYRLMDIRVAFTRAGIFIAVYTLVLGLPFAVAISFKNQLIQFFGAWWWMLPLGLMAALATVGPFIYIYVERKAEEKLLREQKRYQNILKQASMGMTRIRDLRRLLDLITHIVTKTVGISYAAVYLHNSDTDEFVLQVMRDKGRMPVLKITSDNPLIAWIMAKREPLIYEEIKRQMEDTGDETYKYLEKNMRLLTASVIIPSFLEDRFMGFFVLGDKVSGQIYTPEDLDVFQVLASQAALAIENAQFYDETQKMQEQVAQAEKMATIGTMADGLSHQINNRFYALSLIAGDTIDTIKITDTSKCAPEVKEMIDSISHALERIQTNVMQGGEVVKGILKYSRKGDESFGALTLDQIIDGTLEMVQYKVKLSEIDIVRDYPKDTSKIKGNLVQLQEAFFNFIDNAYDAIVERRTTLKEDGYRGRITVSTHQKDNALEIAVEDNGMGIKEDNANKVFTPFFTTKTSARKGTGLGLYVIRRIITDTHKGKIAFESSYKVGTRFILELPIAK